MTLYSALRRFYSRLKPILDDDKEEPIVDQLFEKAKAQVEMIKRTRNLRSKNYMAENLFDDLVEIFDTMLEMMNKHDLSFKSKERIF